jgi:hypothetical protein
MKMEMIRRSTSFFSFMAVLILLIGAVGVCYANWSTQLGIISSVSTGEFCVDVDFDLPGGEQSAAGLDKPGSFFVAIVDAAAGSETFLPFSVTNNGSIPVTYSIQNISAEGGLTITLAGGGGVLEPGESRQGEVIIAVPEEAGGDAEAEYGFSFELNFSQPMVRNINN